MNANKNFYSRFFISKWYNMTRMSQLVRAERLNGNCQKFTT